MRQRNPKRKRDEVAPCTPRERVEQERLSLSGLDVLGDLQTYAIGKRTPGLDPVVVQQRLGRDLARHAPGRIAPMLALARTIIDDHPVTDRTPQFSTVMHAFAQARHGEAGPRWLAEEICTLLQHGLLEHLPELQSRYAAFRAFACGWIQLYRDPSHGVVPQADLANICKALAPFENLLIMPSTLAEWVVMPELFAPGSAQANRERLVQLLDSDLSWRVKGEVALGFATAPFAGEAPPVKAAISLEVAADRLMAGDHMDRCRRQVVDGPMGILDMACSVGVWNSRFADRVGEAAANLKPAQRMVCARAMALSEYWPGEDPSTPPGADLVGRVLDFDARGGILAMACLAAAQSGRDPLIRRLRPGAGNATGLAEAMATQLQHDHRAELGIRMVDDPLAVFEPLATEPEGGLDDELAGTSQESAKAFALSVLDEFYAIPGVFEPDREAQGAHSARAHLESLWTDARITDAPTRAEVALRLFKGAGHLLTPEDFLRTLDQAELALPKLAPEEPLRPREADQASGAFGKLDPLFAHSAWQLEIHQTLPRLFGLEDLLGKGALAPGSVQARAPEIRQMLDFVDKQIVRLARLSSLASTTPSADRYASLAKGNRGRQHAAVKQLNEYQTRLEQLRQMLSSVPDGTSSSSSSAAVPIRRGDAKPSPGSRIMRTEAAVPAASFAPGSG